ncbi:hypothetical protein NPIL_274211 [Nephila pilipes]|uniref:Uncharacterized protein n=1 Tax=Nephila pilipes TaxID=299642 RepID=A0A8X6T5X1_NEPPI|nr:hypothetical protein NPIL_108561 [Nephila pilipes]GFS81898.1 hypothetical protein NPIL_331261 [Nephila pilipes]GFT15808.1 hypothetical protein NPIL_37551 [Nephila pilipes]GFU44376.1 hypothetical protein NPIL_274211 [Nephila pilipes]
MRLNSCLVKVSLVSLEAQNFLSKEKSEEVFPENWLRRLQETIRQTTRRVTEMPEPSEYQREPLANYLADTETPEHDENRHQANYKNYY